MNSNYYYAHMLATRYFFQKGFGKKMKEKERGTRLRKRKDDEVGTEVEWKGRGGREEIIRCVQYNALKHCRAATG